MEEVTASSEMLRNMPKTPPQLGRRAGQREDSHLSLTGGFSCQLPEGKLKRPQGGDTLGTKISLPSSYSVPTMD